MASKARLRAPALVLTAVGAMFLPVAAEARVYLTRQAALEQVFGPGARIETASAFLTPAQVKAAETLAGAKLASARVISYRATRGDSLLGTAYLDTHPVRTLMETVLIVVTPDSRVGAVEVLAFQEPRDYLPPRRWLDQLEDRTLSRDLRPGGALPTLSGATLTARAVASAVRRTLALHRILVAGTAAPRPSQGRPR